MRDAYPSPESPARLKCIATIAVGRMEFRIADRLSTNGVAWLEARGLCPVTASRYEWVTAEAGRCEWIAVPTIVRGVVVGWQFRRMGDGEPRFITTGDAAKHVWNFDVLLDDTLAGEPLVITEGRADCLAAIQSGFIRSISIPGGAPDKAVVTAEALSFIAPVEALVKDTKRIVISTDGDGPGLVMQNEIAKRLGRGRCAYVAYPHGTKDLNQILLGYGEGQVSLALTRADWLHVKGGYLPSELPPRPRQRQHVSGMPGLDDKFRVRRQDVSVLTGYPGSGKSTWLNDFTARMAENHGWRTLFASFEQPPQTQHMWALRQLRLGKMPDEMTKDEIRAADEWIERWARFVIPDEDEPATMQWLYEVAATMIVRHAVDMIVLDPFNEMEHDIPAGKPLTQYIGDTLRDVKRFARKWDVHFLIAAHPAKVQTKAHEELPEPRLDQISDSAHWWNKADVGIILHPMAREDGQRYTQCRIAKSKYHAEIGKPGVVPMTLNTRTGRYHEIAV